jgi:hypothetical protein
MQQCNQHASKILLPAFRPPRARLASMSSSLLSSLPSFKRNKRPVDEAVPIKAVPSLSEHKKVEASLSPVKPPPKPLVSEWWSKDVGLSSKIKAACTYGVWPAEQAGSWIHYCATQQASPSSSLWRC